MGRKISPKMENIERNENKQSKTRNCVFVPEKFGKSPADYIDKGGGEGSFSLYVKIINSLLNNKYHFFFSF